MDPILKCPQCDSERIAVTAEQMFMINTLEHYCHSVKTQDDNAKVECLDCHWAGKRGRLEALNAPKKG
jgi:Zn finger protein HypA/HybF involved in hydrogenase expression